MRRTIAVTFVGILALGCSGFLEGTDAPLVGDPPATDALAPAVDDGDGDGDEGSPPLRAPSTDPFEDLDGWIGLGVEADPGDWWWVPRSGGAVVSWDVVGWESVRQGTSFVGLTRLGPVDLVFTGIGPVPWCGGTRDAATFDSTSPVGPGVVWIVTDASGRVPSAANERRGPSSSRRLFSVQGGAEVDIQQSGKSGRTVVEWGGTRPWIVPFDSSGLDLRNDDAVGPMWPELVLTKATGMWILFRVHEPETVGWEWVFMDGGKGRSLGRSDVNAGGCGGA